MGLCGAVVLCRAVCGAVVLCRAVWGAVVDDLK